MQAGLSTTIREQQYLVQTAHALAVPATGGQFGQAFTQAVPPIPAPGPQQIRRQEDNSRAVLPPFSLSRLLTLWWLAIVMLSLLYAFYMTLTIDVINDTALTLMGLSVAVIAGATLVDRTTAADNTLDTRLATDVAGLTANPQTVTGTTFNADLKTAVDSGLVSNGFWSDLLSERPGSSVDPHRLQLLFFSVAFGVYYLFQLNPLVALPTFSTTVLTLLGISSVTFLGFKLVK